MPMRKHFSFPGIILFPQQIKLALYAERKREDIVSVTFYAMFPRWEGLTISNKDKQNSNR